MSELGDLLETLHSAGRFRTVRAVFHIWRHHERSLAAFRADAEASGATMFAAVHVDEDGEEPEPAAESEVRLWIEQPERVRLEYGDEHVAVKDGAKWWTWHRELGASTNVGSDREASQSIADEYMPLLDPAPLIGALEWTADGRDGPRIHATARPREATRRQDDMLAWGLHAFGGGADEYRFDIDADSGAVLRVEARFHGEPFQVIEAAELEFDEELHAGTFVFEVPEGEELRTWDDWGPSFGLPIAEIVERATFTVLVPDRVPDDWKIDSHYTPARERPAMPESVILFYRSRDATGAVSLSQSRPGDDHADLLRGPGWEEMERSAVHFRMRPRTRDWRQPQLYIEREGTAVMMTSDTLSNDDLIELALSLRPASGGSPLGGSA